MSDQTVAAAMRTEFLTLTPDMPMRDAVMQLLDTRASAAPVVSENGELAGILSQKDCFAAALHSAYYQRWSDTVRQHMSEEVVTLDAETDIVTAAERFRTLPFRSFPVLRDGRLAGMLGRADLLRAFLALG